MISLTTSLSVPNIQRIELMRYQLLDDVVPLTIVCQVAVRSSQANNRSKTFDIIVRNGTGEGIDVNASADNWNDAVKTVPVTVSNGYDLIEAAYTGANKAARKRSVETALMANLYISAALSGAVS